MAEDGHAAPILPTTAHTPSNGGARAPGESPEDHAIYASMTAWLPGIAGPYLLMALSPRSRCDVGRASYHPLRAP